MRWKVYKPDGDEGPLLQAAFRATDCQPCPLRARCTRSAAQPRHVLLRSRAGHETLAAARSRQRTSEYRKLYAQRRSVEGTLSQAVHTFGLRRPLPRAGQGGSSEHRHRRRAQPRPDRRLARLATARTNPSFALRRTRRVRLSPTRSERFSRGSAGPPSSRPFPARKPVAENSATLQGTRCGVRGGDLVPPASRRRRGPSPG